MGLSRLPSLRWVRLLPSRTPSIARCPMHNHRHDQRTHGNACQDNGQIHQAVEIGKLCNEASSHRTDELTNAEHD